MIAFPAGAKGWLTNGATDMRSGMNCLALTVQKGSGRDPQVGEIFCFRGRRGIWSSASGTTGLACRSA
jgi:transposase